MVEGETMLKNDEGNIKVSVVITTYNSEKYVGEMLDSIIAQTLADIEIICVDDGSKDLTVQILNEYAKKDSRLSVLHQTEASNGAAKARNLGVREARGEYISVLDSDDIFEKEMLETAYVRAKNDGSDVVVFDGDAFDTETGEKVNRVIVRPENLPVLDGVVYPEENADRIFMSTLGAAWNCLFRREFVEKNAIEFMAFQHADDLGFVYVAFACANQISFINKRFVHYRNNVTGSQNSNAHLWIDSCCGALSSLKQELNKRNKYELFKVGFAQKAMEYVKFYIEQTRNYPDYENLIVRLKNECLPDWGLEDIDYSRFTNKSSRALLQGIKEYTAGDLLIKLFNGIDLFKSDAARFSELIPHNSGVIIYGAGNYGSWTFEKLKLSRFANVIDWVDRNYESIGYPISNPEIILEKDFDYIIIAIINESTVQSVKNMLTGWGIDGKKIVWIGTIFE